MRESVFYGAESRRSSAVTCGCRGGVEHQRGRGQWRQDSGSHHLFVSMTWRFPEKHTFIKHTFIYPRITRVPLLALLCIKWMGWDSKQSPALSLVFGKNYTSPQLYQSINSGDISTDAANTSKKPLENRKINKLMHDKSWTAVCLWVCCIREYNENVMDGVASREKVFLVASALFVEPCLTAEERCLLLPSTAYAPC